MTETDVAGFDEIDLERLDPDVLDAPVLGAVLAPAAHEAVPSPRAPEPVVVALVAALSRCRGLPEQAVALAHPLHAPDAADRLVVDLSRCRGTSEQVVRLAFGLPVTGTW